MYARFTNALCPFLPLLSNIMVQPLRYVDGGSGLPLPPSTYNHTEGHVERWMRTVKYDICEGKKHSLTEFVLRMHNSLCGRMKIFRLVIPSEFVQTEVHTN